MPKKGGGGLGLGLGLNRKQQGAFTAAASGGNDAFQQYMAAHPQITKRLGTLETNRAGTAQGQNWAAMTKQYGLSPVKPGQTPPGTTAPTTPAGPATADPTDPNWYQKFVSSYELPMPKELEQAGGAASADLARLGAMPLPSYEDQFNTYKDLMNRELEKQTADLTESMGSQGGRYSSDLMTAQNTMRRQGLQDLSAQGITAMTNLNQQRMQELGGAMNVLQGVGASRGNIQQNAAQTAWQNYLMGTSPPEMMDKMLQWSAAFTPPGTVVTQK